MTLMTFILISWLSIFFMITSIGGLSIYGLSFYTKSLFPKSFNLFQVFWVGFVVIIAISQLLSLIIPLNSIVLIFWILTSLIGFPVFISIFRKRNPSDIERSRFVDWVKIIIFILFTILVVTYGINGVNTDSWSDAYDTNLYHFNIIRWMNDYAVVPGLGNLHCRLGYNSGFLVISALLDNLWWDGRTVWLTYSLFVVMACIQWLWIILFQSHDIKTRQRIFCLLTSGYLIRLLTTMKPTLYFDNIALLLQLILMCELLRGVPIKPAVNDTTKPFNPNVISWLITLVTVSVAGFSVKPIGAISLVFVLTFSAVYLIWCALQQQICRAKILKTVIAVYAIAGLVLVGHLSRNAILTGWLLYPLPIVSLNVDWAMPEHQFGDSHEEELQSVRGYYNVIKAWSRLPGPQYRDALSKGTSYWFPQWEKRVWRGIEPQLLYLGIVLILAHLVWIMNLYGENIQKFLWDVILIGLSATNLCFWFLSAPDLRYGNGLFWIWMGIGGSMLLSKENISPVLTYIISSLIVVYSLYTMHLNYGLNHLEIRWQIGKATTQDTKKIVLNNNKDLPLLLYVPTKGDLCGNSEIPCTPYPLNTLQMRKKNCLKTGFKYVAKK